MRGLAGRGAPALLKNPKTLNSAQERGWTLAWAHVRGGGELGRAWHEAATRAAKVTSVTDLEACADWLVAARLAAPGRVALVAESAGGLTAGAALMQRPGAYGAAVLQVGRLPCLRLPCTMHLRSAFSAIPMTLSRYGAVAQMCLTGERHCIRKQAYIGRNKQAGVDRRGPLQLEHAETGTPEVGLLLSSGQVLLLPRRRMSGCYIPTALP